jgi:hypothetical protein
MAEESDKKSTLKFEQQWRSLLEMRDDQLSQFSENEVRNPSMFLFCQKITHHRFVYFVFFVP